MYDHLKKIYIAITAPVFVCFTVVYIFRRFYPPIDIPAQVSAFIAVMLFILTAIFALAGPILYRSFFAHSHRHLHDVPYTDLFIFERNLTGMALVAPYLALGAYFLQIPRFYLATIILMALYAVYYYYPSQRRIRFDEKIFRVCHVMPIDTEQ